MLFVVTEIASAVSYNRRSVYMFRPCLQSSSSNPWNFFFLFFEPLDRGLPSSQNSLINLWSVGGANKPEGGEPGNSLKVAGVLLFVLLVICLTYIYRCPRTVKKNFIFTQQYNVKKPLARVLFELGCPLLCYGTTFGQVCIKPRPAASILVAALQLSRSCCFLARFALPILTSGTIVSRPI